MALNYIIRDTNPQYGGNNYLTGLRRFTDESGKDLEAADFGPKTDAMHFSQDDASFRVDAMNKFAGRELFVVEKDSICSFTTFDDFSLDDEEEYAPHASSWVNEFNEF